MGASGWSYIVPYSGDPAAALTDLRARTLASDDFYWEDDGYLGSKPASVSELDALRETEEFWEVGTHSILDVDRIITSDADDHDGTVRQLPEDEAHASFGTTTPTRAQFQQAEATIPMIRRWSGQYQLLYEAGQPTEIVFWGFSGD